MNCNFNRKLSGTSYMYCAKCGLISLNNILTRLAAKKCKGERIGN